jgi:hypothetical protein
VILFLFVPGVALASGEPDAFALSGISARTGGMGNAFIGLSDDIESIYYNPAGLGNLIDSGVTAMYQTPMLQTSRSFLGLNKRLSYPSLSGSIGFGWLRLRSTDIELTSSDERILGTDTLTNDLFLLGAGVHPLAHWSAGLSLKYFRFAFNGFTESGFGWDAGVHAQYNPFRFGFALTDITGTTLKGASAEPGATEAKDKVPMRFRPGAAFTLNRPFDLPVDWSVDVDGLIKTQGAQDMRLFVGSELWVFNGRAALRGGIEQQVGPTIGFGLRLGMFQLDYSYLFSAHLQDENRLGTTIHF